MSQHKSSESSQQMRYFGDSRYVPISCGRCSYKVPQASKVPITV